MISFGYQVRRRLSVKTTERKVVDNDFDSYAPGTDTGYSRDKFYVRATDTKGHNKSWRYGPDNQVLSIPPELHAMMSVLRERFAEYKSNADIMRDALIHVFHMRADQLKDPSAAIEASLAESHALADIESITAKMQREEKLLQTSQFLLDNARNDPMTTMDVIRQLRAVAGTSHSAPFKARVEDLIRRYDVFGDLERRFNA